MPVRRRPSPRRGERRGGRRGGWGGRRPPGMRDGIGTGTGPLRASTVACAGPRAFCARCVIALSRLCSPGPGGGRAGWCPPGAPAPCPRGRGRGLLPAAHLGGCRTLREARSLRVCVCEGPAQPRCIARVNFCLPLSQRSVVFPVKYSHLGSLHTLLRFGAEAESLLGRDWE